MIPSSLPPVVLDTHALVWLLTDDYRRLGAESRRIVSEAMSAGLLAVSAFSFWEVAMLTRINRLSIGQPHNVWKFAVGQAGIVDLPLTGEIAILAVELDGLPKDPADRIITATALFYKGMLITADAAILGWPSELRRLDARR